MTSSATFRRSRERSLSFDTGCRFLPSLFDRLRKERSVLITPGDHFGVGRYIRVGYGYDVDYTLRGLARVDLTLQELKKRAGSAKSVRGETARRGAA